ncbi:MAG: 30S ribosomal protein S6, partial [Nitrospinota bacterium]
MNTYESIFILNPDLPEEKVEEHIRAVEDLIKASGGTVAQVERWGKKRLAYEVKKHRYGIYVLVHFSGPANTVPEIERYYKITEPVMKYLSIRTEELPEPPAKAAPEEAEAPEQAVALVEEGEASKGEEPR